MFKVLHAFKDHERSQLLLTWSPLTQQTRTCVAYRHVHEVTRFLDVKGPLKQTKFD